MPMAKTKLQKDEITRALFDYFKEKYGVRATQLWYDIDGGTFTGVKYEYEIKPVKENV